MLLLFFFLIKINHFSSDRVKKSNLNGRLELLTNEIDALVVIIQSYCNRHCFVPIVMGICHGSFRWDIQIVSMFRVSNRFARCQCSLAEPPHTTAIKCQWRSIHRNQLRWVWICTYRDHRNMWPVLVHFDLDVATVKTCENNWIVVIINQSDGVIILELGYLPNTLIRLGLAPIASKYRVNWLRPR